jgi:hypothetical protein
MHKISLLLLILIFTSAIFAQTPNGKPKQLTEQEKIILKINREVEDSTIVDFLQKCDYKISQSIKKDKPLIALQYFSFSTTIKLWLKYRWFIADTGLSKKWLKRVQELLAYMSKTQSYIEAAKINGQTQTAQYKKVFKYFKTAQDNFSKLIKKPVRVSAKVRRKAKQQKTRWQKAMRKKYKIKKQENYE